MKAGDRVRIRPTGETGTLWQDLNEVWPRSLFIGTPAFGCDLGWTVRLDTPFFASGVKQTEVQVATSDIEKEEV